MDNQEQSIKYGKEVIKALLLVEMQSPIKMTEAMLQQSEQI